MIENDAAYSALTSRDPRFDGVFYVGVTSTGVYCRPICPARTPMQKNCRFFESAETAEKCDFRPCLRCRPELAPGAAPVDDARRIAHLICERMDERSASDRAGLEDIAASFELSTRQLRRIVQKELGVSPVELLQTRRLLLAKQLLTETALPVTDVAFASGFASLRRFNEAFLAHCHLSPSKLRKQSAVRQDPLPQAGTSTLRMTYRPPFDWPMMLAFLRAHRVVGVEHITDTLYARTVRIGAHTGWIAVTNVPDKRTLLVEFSHTLTPVLPALLGRLRCLFDLSARPDLIDAHLAQDARLRASVTQDPGIRVPGAFDGFEVASRAILGQQITVKAATTVSSRFAGRFGEAVVTPYAELTRLTPTAQTLADATVDDIAILGIISARARAIIALAQACVRGDVVLEAGTHPDAAIKQLVEVPGIGNWTAHYIAMRGLRWPDAFPSADIALRKALGGVTAKEAEARSQAWRPWRSYAVMHLWNSLSDKAQMLVPPSER